MQTELLVALGLGLPLLGTTLGAAGALGLRRASERGERLALGFAAGVMLAASVWSLLLPAIDAAAARGLPPWWPAVGGFLAGTLALGLLRRAAERRFGGGERRRVFLLACSVTLHNIPEGMAVGAALASALAGDAPLMGALALSFGIAVQNVPEGGVIALPLALAGRGRGRAFAAGVLSGVVEPLAGALGLALTALTGALLPWALSFAAGCMFFVVTEELLGAPEEDGACLSAASAAVGFALMMVLDVALG